MWRSLLMATFCVRTLGLHVGLSTDTLSEGKVLGGFNPCFFASKGYGKGEVSS